MTVITRSVCNRKHLYIILITYITIINNNIVGTTTRYILVMLHRRCQLYLYLMTDKALFRSALSSTALVYSPPDSSCLMFKYSTKYIGYLNHKYHCVGSRQLPPLQIHNILIAYQL